MQLLITLECLPKSVSRLSQEPLMAVSLEIYLLLGAEGQVRVTFISWAGEMLQSITGRFSVAIAK